MDPTTTRKHTPLTRTLCLILALLTALLMTGIALPAAKPVRAEAANQPIDLYILGNQVTYDNRNDILGSSSAVKFSYDYNSNTLHLAKRGSDPTVFTNDSRYQKGTEYCSVIRSELSSLNISTDSEVTLMDNTTTYCVIWGSGLTFTGSGKLNLKNRSGFIIRSNNLTFRNANVNVDGNGFVQYYNNGDVMLKFINSNMNFSLGVRGLVNSKYKPSVSMSDSYFSSPEKADFNTYQGLDKSDWWTYVKDTVKQSNVDNFTITAGVKPTEPPTERPTSPPSSTTYEGIKIRGKEVTSLNKNDILGDGVFSYDPDSKTLYIRKDYYDYNNDEEYTGSLIENTGIDGLTINADDGTNSVSLDGFDEENAAPIKLSKNTTFTGKLLVIHAPSECGIRTTGSPTITFNAQMYIHSGRYNHDFTTYGIYGTTGTKLVFNSDWIEIYDIDVAAVYGVGSVVCGSGYDIMPNPWCCSNGIREGRNAGAPLAKTVGVVKIENYDLKIGSTQVTNINKDDILGDGRFKYEPAISGGENTLYVDTKGGTYNGNITSYIEKFRISSESNSKINGTIALYGNTRFQWSNSSSLTVNCIKAYNGKNLTFVNCNVIVGDKNATTPDIEKYILAEGTGNITIASSVFAEGGICSRKGNIILDGAYIKSPRGAVISPFGKQNSAVNFNGSLSTMVQFASGSKPVEFFSNSMTLGGTLGLNFYADLSALSTNQLSGIYTEFKLFNNDTIQRADFDANKMNSAKTGYGFGCKINMVSMADPVQATLYYSNGKTVRKTASAQDYLKKFSSADKPKTWNMIKSINDVGYYMQIYLSEHAKGKWELGVDHKKMEKAYATPAYYKNNKQTYIDALKNLQKTQTALVTKDVQKINYSLVLDADTTINFKVLPTASYTAKPTITIDGKAATVTKVDGRWQASLRNIPADKLGDMHTVVIKTANGSTTVKASAMSYVYACITDSRGDEEYNAMCALYEYWQATLAYKTK